MAGWNGSVIPGRSAARTFRPMTPDVLVLGGGPAGAAAAAMLARLGHRVMVLARPRRHPLGESIPPSTRGLLSELGILHVVDGAAAVRSQGNTVWWGGESGRIEPFPPGMHGWQVERPGFDRALLDAARAAGASMLWVTVHAVHVGAGEPRVTCRASVLERTLTTRWVLDCTGRAGVLARRGLRVRGDDPGTFAVSAVWERPHWDVADPTHTLVESFEDGWAWSVPVSPAVRYVAAMVDTRPPAATGDELTARYDRELTKTRHLAALVRGAHRRDPPQGCSAAPYTASHVGGPGWLLVGDAASFIDPLSSFGIKKALASAWLAAVVVHTCLTDSAIASAALALYEAREQETVRELRRRTAAMFGEAAAAHQHRFWTSRAASEPPAAPGELDVDVLREDPAVRRAFDAIRASPRLAVESAPGLRPVRRAGVRDLRVVWEDHLACPWQPDGIRYLRGINVPRVVALAPACGDVRELYRRYVAAEGPASITDLLGVVAVLVGKAVLLERGT